jgi:hypothetical protein
VRLVRLEIAPVNTQEINRVTEASYVEKPVIGRRPPLEFTGDGPEEITVLASASRCRDHGISFGVRTVAYSL